MSVSNLVAQYLSGWQTNSVSDSQLITKEIGLVTRCYKCIEILPGETSAHRISPDCIQTIPKGLAIVALILDRQKPTQNERYDHNNAGNLHETPFHHCQPFGRQSLMFPPGSLNNQLHPRN